MKNIKSIEQLYSVTTDSVPNKYLDMLPPKMVKVLDKFHDEMLEFPKQTAKAIEKLDPKYRTHPLFINYLITCYQILKKPKKAKQLAKMNYDRNKDYLFAKINYGEICLEEERYDDFLEIFEHKFSLSLIYPDRTLFHISEVKSFLFLMAKYHYLIDEIENSKYFYNKYKELSPKDKALQHLEMLYFVKNIKKNNESDEILL